MIKNLLRLFRTFSVLWKVEARNKTVNCLPLQLFKVKKHSYSSRYSIKPKCTIYFNDGQSLLQSRNESVLECRQKWSGLTSLNDVWSEVCTRKKFKLKRHRSIWRDRGKWEYQMGRILVHDASKKVCTEIISKLKQESCRWSFAWRQKWCSNGMFANFVSKRVLQYWVKFEAASLLA